MGHSFTTSLARGKVHPKVAQALARHSTITLTMDRYRHAVLEDQTEALGALPGFDVAEAQKAQATGTDDAEASCAMLDTNGAFGAQNRHGSTRQDPTDSASPSQSKPPENAAETALSGDFSRGVSEGN